MRIVDALESEIVDRHDRGNASLCEQRQVRGGQSGLPIVGVQEVCLPRVRVSAIGKPCGGAREQAEAQRVVVPFPARCILVGAAGAVVERRVADDPSRHVPGKDRFEQVRRGQSGQRFDPDGASNRLNRRHHRRVARQDHAHVDAGPSQGGGKRTGDVAQPAGLDEGGILGRGEDDAQWWRPVDEVDGLDEITAALAAIYAGVGTPYDTRRRISSG